jgi:D-alanine-D-alanine ligase
LPGKLKSLTILTQNPWAIFVSLPDTSILLMLKKIALVTGGYSRESVISYESAKTVQRNLDSALWEHYLIDIRTDGWFHRTAQGAEIPIDKNDFSLKLGDEHIRFDAALIVLHGTPGEDGKLQGYFDCIGLPYTSCDAATSALTFNKRYTVAVAAFGGIRVARSLHIFRHSPIPPEAILEQLNLPVFVKPNNGGSSIGMSKVSDPSELQPALDKAFCEDEQVLVEEYIRGREFTIGVFRNAGKISTLPITEVISKKDFFDYEAKYHGESEEITPAKVDEAVAQKIRDAAMLAYRIFNCSGVVRIDFIYDPEKEQPYMLEINTVPGQSEASIVPQQVRAMGWTLTRFYSGLIEECLSGRKEKTD